MEEGKGGMAYLLAHAVSHAWEHGGAARQDDVAIQVLQKIGPGHYKTTSQMAITSNVVLCIANRIAGCTGRF